MSPDERLHLPSAALHPLGDAKSFLEHQIGEVCTRRRHEDPEGNAFEVVYAMITSTFPAEPGDLNEDEVLGEKAIVAVIHSSETKDQALPEVSTKSIKKVSAPIPQAAERTAFLIDTLGSGAEVARLLGVNRSQPTQWRSGKESPSPRVAQQLLDLDYVLAKALQIWPAKAALDWFEGSNDYLDGARPIDVLKLRGATEVVQALEVAMA